MSSPTRILLATDGSCHALEAARFAATLLDHEAVSQVTVVAVIRPFYLEPFGEPITNFPMPQSMYDQLTAAARDAAQQAAAATVAELGPLAGRAQVTIREGWPAEEILRLVEEERIDLVVLGSRGWDEARPAMLGGVAEQVLHGAPCTVLLTRPIRPEAQGDT